MKKSTRIILVIILLVFAYLVYQKINQEVKPQILGTSIPATVTLPVQIPTTQVQEDIWYEVYFTQPNGGYTESNLPPIEKALLRHVNAAQTSIDIAYFEQDLQPLTDALIAAKERGVLIRLVYDNEYSDPDPQTQTLIDSGIIGVPDQRSSYMHNKFLVIDNQCIWTGSFNFTHNAAFKNNENALYICNPELVQNYTTEFTELYNGNFGIKSPSDTPNPLITIANHSVKNFFAPEDGVMSRVISAVGSANYSINFLVFSFTDQDLAMTMLDRAKAGVIIRGVFETKGAGSQYSMCSYLKSEGQDVRLDVNPNTLHDKIIIIDERVVITGSFNFSGNANKSNDENLLIIDDENLAREYLAEFNRLYNVATVPDKNCQR